VRTLLAVNLISKPYGLIECKQQQPTTMDRLSSKHRQAIAALLSNPTIEAAALEVGVTARTLRRWRDEPVFAAALATAESALLSQVARTMVTAANEAVDVLRSVMADDESARQRTAAARAILQHLPAIRLLGSIDARLARLEIDSEIK